MTMEDIVKEVCRRTGAERHLTWGMFSEIIEVVSDSLRRGEDVKIRNFGSFRWVDYPTRKVGRFEGGTRILEKGQRLKFVPSRALRTRRSDHGEVRSSIRQRQDEGSISG